MTSVSPVHVGRALESLRNSNYDTVSAMGEVIDNALEANAKNIRIWIKVQEADRKRKDDYTEIAFGDDGIVYYLHPLQILYHNLNFVKILMPYRRVLD